MGDPARFCPEMVGVEDPARLCLEMVGVGDPARPCLEMVGVGDPARLSLEMVGVGDPARLCLEKDLAQALPLVALQHTPTHSSLPLIRSLQARPLFFPGPRLEECCQFLVSHFRISRR